MLLHWTPYWQQRNSGKAPREAAARRASALHFAATGSGKDGPKLLRRLSRLGFGSRTWQMMLRSTDGGGAMIEQQLRQASGSIQQQSSSTRAGIGLGSSCSLRLLLGSVDCGEAAPSTGLNGGSQKEAVRLQAERRHRLSLAMGRSPVMSVAVLEVGKSAF